MTKARRRFLKLTAFMCLIATVFVLTPAVSYGQWTALGPYGGGVHVLANVPSRPDTLIAGTRNALLFISMDATQSWQRTAVSAIASCHAEYNPRGSLQAQYDLRRDHRQWRGVGVYTEPLMEEKRGLPSTV
jgi:hypothetical protein